MHVHVTYQHSSLHLVTFDLQLDYASQAQLDCLAQRLADAFCNRQEEGGQVTSSSPLPSTPAGRGKQRSHPKL